MSCAEEGLEIFNLFQHQLLPARRENRDLEQHPVLEDMQQLTYSV